MIPDLAVQRYDGSIPVGLSIERLQRRKGGHRYDYVLFSVWAQITLMTLQRLLIGRASSTKERSFSPVHPTAVVTVGR